MKIKTMLKLVVCFGAALVLLIAFVVASVVNIASNGGNESMHDLTELQTDITKLITVTKLVYEPESAAWRIPRIVPDKGSILPGRGGFYLVAVLTYDPVVVREIEAAAFEKDRALNVSAGIVEDWYPQSVKERFVPDGDRLTTNVPIYDAASLIDSWLEGFFFIADEKTVFLYLVH